MIKFERNVDPVLIRDNKDLLYKNLKLFEEKLNVVYEESEHTFYMDECSVNFSNYSNNSYSVKMKNSKFIITVYENREDKNSHEYNLDEFYKTKALSDFQISEVLYEIYSKLDDIIKFNLCME